MTTSILHETLATPVAGRHTPLRQIPGSIGKNDQSPGFRVAAHGRRPQ